MTDFYNSSINAELSDVLREVWINDASGENGNSSYNQAEGADENGEIIEAPNNSLVLESDLFFNPPVEDEVTIKDEEWLSLQRQKDTGISDTVTEMVTSIKRAWQPSPHVGRETKPTPNNVTRQFNINSSRYNSSNNMEMWSNNEKPHSNFTPTIQNMQSEFAYHNQGYISREAYHSQPVPQSFNPMAVNRNVQHSNNQLSMGSHHQTRTMQQQNAHVQLLHPHHYQTTPQTQQSHHHLPHHSNNPRSLASPMSLSPELQTNQIENRNQMSYDHAEHRYASNLHNNRALYPQSYNSTYSVPHNFALNTVSTTSSQNVVNSNHSVLSNSNTLSFFTPPMMMTMPVFEKTVAPSNNLNNKIINNINSCNNSNGGRSSNFLKPNSERVQQIGSPVISTPVTTIPTPASSCPKVSTTQDYFIPSMRFNKDIGKSYRLMHMETLSTSSSTPSTCNPSPSIKKEEDPKTPKGTSIIDRSTLLFRMISEDSEDIRSSQPSSPPLNEVEALDKTSKNQMEKYKECSSRSRFLSTFFTGNGTHRVFSSSLECASPTCVSARIKNQKRVVKTRETQTTTLVQKTTDSLTFPDMTDWPSNGGSLKVHRPHLCDQSRIIICRVLAYNREMAKRLGPNSGNTPFAQPDVLTAAMTGFKPNVVRQCDDKKLELLKCTDKGPFTTLATQKVREEARERLAVVFATSDDEESGQRITNSRTFDRNENIRRSERVLKQTNRFPFDNYQGAFDECEDGRLRNVMKRDFRKRPSVESSDELYHDDYIVEKCLEDILCKLCDQEVLSETDSSGHEQSSESLIKKRKVGRPPKKMIYV